MARVVGAVGIGAAVPRDIHPLLSGLPDDFDLPAALERRFEVEPTAPADASITERMQEAGGLALVTGHGTWLLRPRPETVTAASQDLDSSRLDVALQSLP